MKIIDEKGRFFGKISVIDVVVIIFVFLLCIACVYKYINREKDARVQRENEKLVLTFFCGRGTTVCG